MRIGVDFDDVLYPYHRFLKSRIQRRWGVDLSNQKVTTFYYEDLPALKTKGVTRAMIWKEVQDAWEEVESHRDAGLLDPDAPRVLRDLEKRHQVILISARIRRTLPHVQAFLTRHDIRPSRILLGQEEKSGFDVLIDDFPKHALQNVASGGYSLLFHSDENSTYDESAHPRVFRVHTWNEAAETIRRLESRRPSIA